MEEFFMLKKMVATVLHDLKQLNFAELSTVLWQH